jgi:hypothetical protein
MTLREEGFLFAGSRMLHAVEDPSKTVYAADAYQPKSIVSLFNTTCSVFDVASPVSKSEAYQNTVINPENEFDEGVLLTLAIEPLNSADAKRVKNLCLQVESDKVPATMALPSAERLASLRLSLKDSETVLNRGPGILPVLEALASLDRKRNDYYLEISFGNDIDLGQAQALAKVFSAIDCEKGVRIEPPPPGQLYYRAFTPDEELLNREARLFHPWELILTANGGRVQGNLIRFNSVWKEGASAAELEITETPVSVPGDLLKAIDADTAQAEKNQKRAMPHAILVFAPSSLRYGQLTQFLEPVLPTHKQIHVHLNKSVPPIPRMKP